MKETAYFTSPDFGLKAARARQRAVASRRKLNRDLKMHRDFEVTLTAFW
jgi:hypothetical protein